MRKEGAISATIEAKVAFHDIDIVGVMWHGHYLKYLENARWALMDRIGFGFENDEVSYVSTGDGTTSEGEFWESLNTACNLKLPVVYVVEDNGYAISVPVEVNTAGGSISKLVRSFPDLLVEEVDGCDFVASFEVMKLPAQARQISETRNRSRPPKR